MLSPSPIHLPCSYDDIIEKLELLDEGGANISVDDMKEVWDQLSEPTSSPASSSEANSPSLMASSSESDELGHHLEETARFMTRISPPLTPLPPITLIYQVPTKPKNRNPYLYLEDNIIEIHFSYTIPMKVQLYLPGDPAVELPYPVSLYAKLTQVDTDRDMTELLAFETPGQHTSTSSAPAAVRKVRPSVGLQCCTNFRGEAVLLPKVLKPDADPPSQATGRYVLRFSAVVEGHHEHDAVLSILSHVDTVQIHTKAKHPRFTKDLAEDVVQLLDEVGRCTLVRHSEYQLRRLQNIFGHKTIRTPNLCLLTEIFSGESELKWDDFLARFLYFHPHVDDTVLRYLLLEPSGTVTRTAFKLLCEWVGKRWTEKLAQLTSFCRRHFHGLITAAEAEEQVGAAIRDRSADVSGFYLIRMSTSTPGFFALTFTTEKAPKVPLAGDGGADTAATASVPTNKKRKRAIRYHHLQLYVDERTRRLREDHDPAAVEYVSIEDFLMRNTDVFRTEVTRKSRTVKASKPKRRKSDVTPSPAQASAASAAASVAAASAPLTAVANQQSISANNSSSDLSLISNGVRAVEIAV